MKRLLLPWISRQGYVGCHQQSKPYSGRFFNFLKIHLLILFIWEADRLKESSPNGSLLKWLQWPGLGHAEAENQESYADLLCGWRGHKYFSHHQLPPSKSAQIWIGSGVTGTPISTLIWDVDIPSSGLMPCTVAPIPLHALHSNQCD